MELRGAMEKRRIPRSSCSLNIFDRANERGAAWQRTRRLEESPFYIL